MKVAFSGQMRELDRQAIEEAGIPGIVLMENAGRETVRVLNDYYPDLQEARVIVFAGRGNNGGDGFVIARHLTNRGCEVVVFLMGHLDDLSGDAATNARIATAMAIPILEIESKTQLTAQRDVIQNVDIIVDAMFGTGLKRALKDIFSDAVMVINESNAFVVSVDIPSGLLSDTGSIIGQAVMADLTVTYGLPKPGLLIYPGAYHTGQLVVADISIPRTLVDDMHLSGEILSPVHFPAFFSPRAPDSHKGRYGHLLILAGSPGKTGAAILAARAAARTGTGLVTLAAPSPLNTVYESTLAEIMTFPLPGKSPVFHPDHIEAVRDALIGKSAVLIGPGIGTSPETEEFLRALMASIDVPVILDADALNIIATSHGPWFKPGITRILTPHPGEFSRLTDLEVRAVLDEQLDVITDFAGTNHCIVVLKTARTLIAYPDGRFWINITGNPGLAKGGSGDILAGMIAGLAARGLEPEQAAIAGVFWHGLTGDLASEQLGMHEMLAGDMLEFMAAARYLMASEPGRWNGTTVPYLESEESDDELSV